jgi:ribosome biogenesis GTPase A
MNDIQWFPGHMTRARRQIEAQLPLIDVAIELLDARIPLASRNPMADEILQGKPRMIVLNKADLADGQATEAWLAYFRKQGFAALALDSNSGTNVMNVVTEAQKLLVDFMERQRAKGINPRALRALIVGIPNVGKSTLINRLAGRNIAQTGDRPGVTKGQQWINIGTAMQLLDTPGILWPKFEDQRVGYRLAVTGAIKEQILNVEDIAFFALQDILPRYWGALAERFGLSEADKPADLEDNGQILSLMEAIGRRRGALMSGGRIDLEKASGIILRELRSGKLGRITFERVQDVHLADDAADRR